MLHSFYSWIWLEHQLEKFKIQAAMIIQQIKSL